MSQNAEILDYLKDGNALTGLDALKRFQCIHLPRRIKDLREQGHTIAADWLVLPNGKRVKEYRLAR
jgi:hypothetical protein